MFIRNIKKVNFIKQTKNWYIKILRFIYHIRKNLLDEAKLK